MAQFHGDHRFSLTRGGPFYRLLHRCRLVDPFGHPRWIWLAAFAWLPLIVISLIRVVLGRRPEALVFDPAVHARFLVALPLLVCAERMLEIRCRHSIDALRKESVAERTTVNTILDRAEHLRDSRLVEGGLVLAVVTLGQLTVWGVLGSNPLVRNIAHDRLALAGVWYVAIALPFLQFMTLRWLWRWLLWSYVLARLSRRSLATNALHPDRAAGLQMLSTPLDALALFSASVTSVASAAWIMRIHDHQATLQSVAPIFSGFVLVAIVIGCGPLLLFSGQLYRARHRDVTAYHTLANEYVREFRRRWITERGPGSVVGTPDIQSLNDLGASFETAHDTRLVPFGARSIVALCAGAIIPMVPLLLYTLPLKSIALHLGKAAFGL